jgi:hypothetical protein
MIDKNVEHYMGNPKKETKQKKFNKKTEVAAMSIPCCAIVTPDSSKLQNGTPPSARTGRRCPTRSCPAKRRRVKPL